MNNKEIASRLVKLAKELVFESKVAKEITAKTEEIPYDDLPEDRKDLLKKFKAVMQIRNDFVAAYHNPSRGYIVVLDLDVALTSVEIKYLSRDPNFRWIEGTVSGGLAIGL